MTCVTTFVVGVRRGHHAHAALGHWSGGTPPFGYRRAIEGPGRTVEPLQPGRWKARGERIVLVVDTVDATVVRQIFGAYTARVLGVRAIAQQLNARGVPPPAALRRVGRAAWAKGTVWWILRNPIYRYPRLRQGALPRCGRAHVPGGDQHRQGEPPRRASVVSPAAGPSVCRVGGGGRN